MDRRYLLAGLSLSLTALGTATPAAADPSYGTRRVVVPTPVEMFTPHESLISPTLYMNRCIGNCMVKKGSNDARQNQSSIPNADSVVGEFTNSFGQTGAAGTCTGAVNSACTTDAECPTATNSKCETADKQWAATVQCMKEVYSPFGVNVVDARPTDGSNYHMAILAGVPQDIGQSNMVLGIAPLAGDCSPQDNVISFSFANAHSPNDRVNNLCWTIAQESAHAFGLDHEFSYTGSPTTQGPRSACNDPMTYRTDCGGEKFFRNDTAKCGEDVARDCRCGPNQNSHVKLTNVFGPGTPITPPPTASIVFPLTGTTIQNGIKVTAKGYSIRGIARMELWINNHKWSEVPGGPFTQSGQPETPYQLTIPGEVPDSVMDLVVKAYDDLGMETDTTTQTVTKNHACTDDMSCGHKGMTCGEGKCAWPPASGEQGAACDYNEFCLSSVCAPTADGGVCTTACHPGISGECPDGNECEAASPTSGFCLPIVEDPGCCSVGNDSSAVWVHGGLGLLALGFVVRRRRPSKGARA